MKNFKRTSSLLLAIAFCFSLASAHASAASANIGSAYHTYTYTEPVHFYLTASVQYSQLYGNQMTISSMSQTVINYNDSDIALQCPYFLAATGSRYNNTYGYYDLSVIDIPVSDSNTVYTSCNWAQFMANFYPNESTTYTIPTNTNDNSNGFYTEIGIWTGSYYDTSSLAYQHMGYWHGNGTLIKIDLVSNDSPTTTTTTTVSTVPPQSTSSLLSERSNSATLSIASTPNSEIVGMATLPVVATDPNFENILDIDQSNVALDNNGTVSISTPVAESTLYVKAPVILERVSTNKGMVWDSSLFNSHIIKDEESNFNLLVYTYDSNQLGACPEMAALNIGEQRVENTFSQIFYDKQGNETGGRLIFTVPSNFEFPAEYSVELISEIAHFEQQTITKTT